MKNKDIKRVFVIVLSAILVSMNMSMVTYAKENDRFTTSAYANHWGRSDLRAYLNGVEKINSTLPYDTTHDSRMASGYYESQFSDAEYALVQPHTYNTNDFFGSGDGTKTYTTTDKFWLPSGNYNSDQVISWGKNDISSGSQSESIDINRVIPISYWSYSNSGYSWLRSAYNSNTSHAQVAVRGTSIYNMPTYDGSHVAVAPMFKINLSSINFASVASAASIISSSGNSGAKKIYISGSSLFGQRKGTALPDYGMYLKSASNKTFTINELQYANGQITVGYSGAVAEQYVVIQAYGTDSFVYGTTSYVAARKLEGNQTSSTIDVTNWNLSSLAGYNIKVWMEDGSGSLAKATTPETFVGNDGSMAKTTTDAIINNRVFAMKSNLQTSWGTLSNVGDLVGSNPTNQKIYFGKDSDGRPLEFWIAGRENSNGTNSSNGEIMYLYQVKATETRGFNKNPNINISISDNISETYDANPHTCNVTSITVNGEDKLSEIKGSLKWEYRKTGTQEWIEGNPVNAGDYEIRCYYKVSGEDKQIYSNISKLLIGKKSLEYTKTLNEVDALTGSKLSELDVDTMLEKPTSIDGNEEILGLWTFVNPDTVIDRTGKQTQKVVFTPSDDNYEKLEIDITLNVIDNTTLWGEEVTRQDGVTQYVDTNGKTSVKVSRESLDNNGIIWLKEESDGTSIWYGIAASDGTFELDRHLRFYVKWISQVEDSHNNLYDLIDEKTKLSMEKDKSHIFQIGVEDVNGNKVNPSGAIKVYVQLEDNWNTNDVKACFIANGNDENIPVAIEKKNSLVSNNSYAVMTLDHFSPYLIYDQITDEEKEALNKPTDSGMDNSDSIDGESNENNVNKKDNVVDKEIKGTVTSANIGEDNRETSELYKTPNTGDMNNNYWFVIMIISGLGIICVNSCIKMKKSEK